MSGHVQVDGGNIDIITTEADVVTAKLRVGSTAVSADWMVPSHVYGTLAISNLSLTGATITIDSVAVSHVVTGTLASVRSLYSGTVNVASGTVAISNRPTFNLGSTASVVIKVGSGNVTSTNAVPVCVPLAGYLAVRQLSGTTAISNRPVVNFGNTATVHIEDDYGWGVENTPMNEMRVVEPVRLVGSVFQGGTLDTNFWTSATTNTGTVTATGAMITLSSGVVATGSAKVTSVRTARYIGGSSNRYRGVIRLGNAAKAGNTRKWGAFNTTDGAYFKVSGTGIAACVMKGGTETAVFSPNWNNNTLAPTVTSAGTYEIYWTNSKVWFTVGSVLKHTVSATSTTWSNNMALPVCMSNVNVTSTGDSTLIVRTATIYRLGKMETSPIWKYFHSAVTAQILKRSPGRLHRVILNTIPNGTQVTLYDAITATNPIAIIAPPNGSAVVDLNYGLDFYNGLCITTTPASCDVTIVYE